MYVLIFVNACERIPKQIRAKNFRMRLFMPLFMDVWHDLIRARALEDLASIY
jgi:hypothetical protein